MCISRCGVVATVEDGRMTKVNADPAHPNGCICIAAGSVGQKLRVFDSTRGLCSM